MKESENILDFYNEIFLLLYLKKWVGIEKCDWIQNNFTQFKIYQAFTAKKVYFIYRKVLILGKSNLICNIKSLEFLQD